ncbi:MAG: hypothetical protein ACE5ID_10610 [Acidobacteriota bacterium]
MNGLVLAAGCRFEIFRESDREDEGASAAGYNGRNRAVGEAGSAIMDQDDALQPPCL